MLIKYAFIILLSLKFLDGNPVIGSINPGSERSSNTADASIILNGPIDEELSASKGNENISGSESAQESPVTDGATSSTIMTSSPDLLSTTPMYSSKIIYIRPARKRTPEPETIIDPEVNVGYVDDSLLLRDKILDNNETLQNSTGLISTTSISVQPELPDTLNEIIPSNLPETFKEIINQNSYNKLKTNDKSSSNDPASKYKVNISEETTTVTEDVVTDATEVTTIDPETQTEQNILDNSEIQVNEKTETVIFIESVSKANVSNVDIISIRDETNRNSTVADQDKESPENVTSTPGPNEIDRQNENQTRITIEKFFSDMAQNYFESIKDFLYAEKPGKSNLHLIKKIPFLKMKDIKLLGKLITAEDGLKSNDITRSIPIGPVTFSLPKGHEQIANREKEGKEEESKGEEIEEVNEVKRKEEVEKGKEEEGKGGEERKDGTEKEEEKAETKQFVLSGRSTVRLLKQNSRTLIMSLMNVTIDQPGKPEAAVNSVDMQRYTESTKQGEEIEREENDLQEEGEKLEDEEGVRREEDEVDGNEGGGEEEEKGEEGDEIDTGGGEEEDEEEEEEEEDEEDEEEEMEEEESESSRSSSSSSSSSSESDEEEEEEEYFRRRRTN